MRDFDKEWARMERRGKFIGWIAASIMGFTAVLVIAGLILTASLLMHPEALGRFAGKVMSGFEETAQ